MIGYYLFYQKGRYIAVIAIWCFKCVLQVLAQIIKSQWTAATLINMEPLNVRND